MRIEGEWKAKSKQDVNSSLEGLAKIWNCPIKVEITNNAQVIKYPQYREIRRTDIITVWEDYKEDVTIYPAYSTILGVGK